MKQNELTNEFPPPRIARQFYHLLYTLAYQRAAAAAAATVIWLLLPETLINVKSREALNRINLNFMEFSLYVCYRRFYMHKALPELKSTLFHVVKKKTECARNFTRDGRDVGRNSLTRGGAR